MFKRNEYVIGVMGVSVTFSWSTAQSEYNVLNAQYMLGYTHDYEYGTHEHTHARARSAYDAIIC